MKKRIAAALCSLAIIGIQQAYAQPRGKNPSGFADTPFDASVEVLPRGFKGHDCSRIAATLAKLDLQKSEFETKAQHEFRTKELLAQPLLPKIGASDTLAFPLEQAGVKFDFDAETSTLRLELDSIWIKVVQTHTALPNHLTTGIPNFGLPVQTISDKHKRYVAANAYGRTVTVNSVERNVCLAVQGYYSTDLSKMSRVSMSIGPEEARKLKGTVSVVLIVEPVAPMLTAATKYREPTLDNPSKFFAEGPAIVVLLRQILYVDRNSGRIIARATTEVTSKESIRQ